MITVAHGSLVITIYFIINIRHTISANTGLIPCVEHAIHTGANMYMEFSTRKN